jgi:hypothetical protein
MLWTAYASNSFLTFYRFERLNVKQLSSERKVLKLETLKQATEEMILLE